VIQVQESEATYVPEEFDFVSFLICQSHFLTSSQIYSRSLCNDSSTKFIEIFLQKALLKFILFYYSFALLNVFIVAGIPRLGMRKPYYSYLTEAK
jgi:hypothetical protein